MNQYHKYDSYRLNWALFKALFGLNLLLFKLLLAWVQLGQALH
jgi:hypothetical protein